MLLLLFLHVSEDPGGACSMDFVNWNFLEKELTKLKKIALSESLAPSDRMHFDGPEPAPESAAEPESSSGSAESTRETYVLRPKPEEERDAEEIQYIEVKNTKGKIKKINPDDYVVTISAADNNLIFSGSIKKIGSIYFDIANKHGAKKALECIMKDFINRPLPSLNFKQAKMILSSLKNVNGNITKTSIDDVMTRLDQKTQNEVKQWLKRSI